MFKNYIHIPWSKKSKRKVELRVYFYLKYIHENEENIEKIPSLRFELHHEKGGGQNLKKKRQKTLGFKYFNTLNI